MELRECVEADADARLLVIIETVDELSARILGRELQEIGKAAWYVRDRGCRLTLFIEAGEAFDASLARVQEKLAVANRGPEPAGAEVIETRLVAATSAAFLPGQPAGTPVGSFTLIPYAAQPLLPREIPFEGGRAFGSGSHPSTGLAVELLEEAAARQLPETALDVGCGSGVLSLIAAKLGVRRTIGIDICQASLAVARDNVARSHLDSRIAISDTPVQEITGHFDLILANLTLSVLYILLADLGRLCREGGTLIVSGLQGRQAEDLLGRLLERGWRLERRICAGKWQAMRLRADFGLTGK